MLGEEYIYLRMGRKIQSAQPLKSCPKKAFESSKNKFKKLIITIWPPPAQMQYPPAYPSKTNPWASVISEKQNRNCIVRKITTHDNSTSHPEIPRNSMKSSPWVMSGFSHLNKVVVQSKVLHGQEMVSSEQTSHGGKHWRIPTHVKLLNTCFALLNKQIKWAI